MLHKIVLDFTDETRNKLSFLPGLLKKIVKYALKQVVLVEHDVYLSLSVVDSETIHEINKTYRKVDRPTDVLSFPYTEKDEVYGNKNSGMLILGDIFLCYDVASKQAEELGHSTLYEICFLFTHGLLHLLHINHDTDEENKFMEETLLKILTKKGDTTDPWNITS